MDQPHSIVYCNPPTTLNMYLVNNPAFPCWPPPLCLPLSGNSINSVNNLHSLCWPHTLCLPLSGNSINSEAAVVRLMSPVMERSEFIVGPAMFGPRLGGDNEYQVSSNHGRRLCTTRIYMFSDIWNTSRTSATHRMWHVYRWHHR